MSLIRRSFRTITYLIVFCASLFISIQSLFFSRVIIREGVTLTQHMFPLSACVSVIVIVYLVFKTKCFLENHSLFFFGLFFCGVLGVFFLFLNYPIIDDDAAILLSLAQRFYERFVSGGFSLQDFECTYLSVHPFQFGILILEFLLNLITAGNARCAMVLLNLFAVIGVYYFGFRLLAMKANCLVANIYVILFCLNFVPFIYAQYVYGWQIGLFFAMASLFYFVQGWSSDGFQIGKLSISYFLLLIGCFIKSNYSLLAVTYIIAIVINNVSIRKKVLPIFTAILALILCLNISTYAYSFSIGRYETGVPKIMYLAMGQQEGPLGSGWYNGYNGKYLYEFELDKEVASKDAVESLQSRLTEFINNPAYAIRFYLDKFDSTFLVRDFQSHAYFNGQTSTDINDRFENGWLRDLTYFFNNVFFMLFWFGMSLGCAFLLGHKKKFIDYRFALTLGLLGAGGYHMLFETKAIYIFPWVVLGTVVSACGLSELVEYLERIKKLEYTINRKFVFTGIFVVACGLLFYNVRTVYILQDANYTDNADEFCLTKNNYVSFSYRPNDSYTFTDIEVLTNGILPSSGTFAIEVIDENEELLSLNYYNLESFEPGETWLRFVIKPVEVVAGANYTIRLYTDLPDQTGMNTLSLIVGDYVQSPSLSICNLNGYEQNFYLNAKLYGESKGFESLSYLYNQPSLKNRIYPVQY